MSVFYMKHKKHGTKVATEEAEVEHDKKRGWVEFDPEEDAKLAQAASKNALKKQEQAAQTL